MRKSGKNEFIKAYEDNDEEEFIALQTEWYQSLKNTILDVGFVADCIGLDTIAMISCENFVKVVDNEVRNESGWLIKETAQNLNVSFKKILKYLEKKLDTPKAKISAELTSAQVMLYHYILQEAQLEPRFPTGSKEKALETLSIRYKLSKDNLKKRYNVILTSDAKEGYDKDDAKKVRELIRVNNPAALTTFEINTKHILI